MKIELEKNYQSELIANTELHAGGIFFCIVYSNILVFKNNNQVIFTKKIIDPFRPMDSSDIKHIENYKICGNYFTNNRGYLICEFEEKNLKLTGMFLENHPKTIVFNINDNRLNKHWSEIYKIEE